MLRNFAIPILRVISLDDNGIACKHQLNEIQATLFQSNGYSLSMIQFF
jgi:hypothetical protein